MRMPLVNEGEKPPAPFAPTRSSVGAARGFRRALPDARLARRAAPTPTVRMKAESAITPMPITTKSA